MNGTTKRNKRAADYQLQQQRRGALRLDKDSRGYSNSNKRGPKSNDEGCIRHGVASPQQLAFRAYIEEGYQPADARKLAGLPPLR